MIPRALPDTQQWARCGPEDYYAPGSLLRLCLPWDCAEFLCLRNRLGPWRQAGCYAISRKAVPLLAQSPLRVGRAH